MLYSSPSIENNLITNELLLRLFSDYRQKRENLKVRSDEFELLSFDVRRLNNLKKNEQCLHGAADNKVALYFFKGHKNLLLYFVDWITGLYRIPFMIWQKM